MEPTTPTTLTPKEAEVVKLLIAGYSQETIAFKLGVIRNTVWRHKQNACRKVGANCTSMLVALVIVRGIIPVDELVDAITASGNFYPFTSTDDSLFN
jgi:DNA-binding CsgD family transcriptional regulator